MSNTVLVDRPFDFRRGDRIARKPGDTRSIPEAATKDLSEAMDYARIRANVLRTRQYLKKHKHHGWWVVFSLEEDL